MSVQDAAKCAKMTSEKAGCFCLQIFACDDKLLHIQFLFGLFMGLHCSF